MAIKKEFFVGKTKMDGVARIRNVKGSSVRFPLTCELQIFPDEQTYKEVQDQERGYLLNEDGTPLMVKDKVGKLVRAGVTKIDLDEAVYKTVQLNSRDLGPEKDKEFREKVFALYYEYFCLGKEKI